MKGPRYILKKVHLEQCQMEEYRNHLRRMEEIKKNHNKQFKLQVDMTVHLQELRQRHVQRDSQHRE